MCLNMNVCDAPTHLLTSNINEWEFSCATPAEIIIYTLSLHICYVVLQVVSQYSNILSPLCVDAVLKVINPADDSNVDLRDIRLVQKLGYV